MVPLRIREVGRESNVVIGTVDPRNSDEFEQVCDGCGARLLVKVAHHPSYARRQCYECPECGTPLDCLGSSLPRVHVLSTQSGRRRWRRQSSGPKGGVQEIRLMPVEKPRASHSGPVRC